MDNKLILPAFLLSASVFLNAGGTHAQNGACLACQFKTPNESKTVGHAEACDDLFGAACMDKKGGLKYEGAQAKLVSELSLSVEAARNRAAQAMGYGDLGEAIRDRLKESGITPLPPPSNANNPFLQGSYPYKESEECAKDFQELFPAAQNQSPTPMDAQAQAALIAKMEAFEAKYKERIINLSAQDIPNFVSNDIGQKCASLKSQPDIYKPENNKEALKLCQNQAQIRRKAVDLFRAEGSKDYEKKAQAFVREHMLPNLNADFNFGNYGYGYGGAIGYPDPSSTSAPPKTIEDLLKSQDRFNELFNAVGTYCTRYSLQITSIANKVTQEVYAEVAKSKPVIDTLIDTTYTERRKQLADKILQNARSDIQDLVKSITKDQTKRNLILNEYDSLEMAWLEKPKNSAYMKNTRGLLSLREPPSNSPHAINESVFFDPTLSHFTILNAFYVPLTVQGKSAMKEQVAILPIFLHKLESNPYMYLSTLAHEIGHKIGPRISKVNGHDLSNEYKSLLACYSDSTSIKMEAKQADETIADYISSEVLARQIQKLPANKRREALFASVEGLCHFNDINNQSHAFNCNGVHPEESLRISGIIGANPSIRKILGCGPESPKFKTCGLSTSILDLPEGNAPIKPTILNPATGVQ